MKPVDFYNLTWSQYQRACIGYRVRIDRQWDYTRHIILAQLRSNGLKVGLDDIYKCIFDKPIPEAYISPDDWELTKKAFNIKTKYDA